MNRREACQSVDGRPLLLGSQEMESLFVYGTLLPLDFDANLTEGEAVEQVRGRMFDLGTYPGLVDPGDPEANWVSGCIRSVDRGFLEECLDPYEGVEEGLFRRELTLTRSGKEVWIYVYQRPLDQSARGPLTSWDGPRGVWPR